MADKPEKLDDALVGLFLFMRWPAPHGWQVGKITSKITSATSRLFKSFDYVRLHEEHVRGEALPVVDEKEQIGRGGA